MASGERVRAERVEVQRSREQILAAAELHYSRTDVDPSMAELAKLAGIGNATLYRRYPSIGEVVEELYAKLMGELQPVADRVLAQATGWEAVVTLVNGIVHTMQDHPAIPRLNRKMVARDTEHRHGGQWEASLDDLVRWAQAEGTLRPDINANDITFAAFRIGSYSNLPPNERDRVLGRQIGIVLDGLRADGRRSELPRTPITSEDLHDIFRYEVANPVPDNNG